MRSLSSNLPGQLKEAEMLLRTGRQAKPGIPLPAQASPDEHLPMQAVAALGATHGGVLTTAAARLAVPATLEDLLPIALDGAISQMRSDFGNIQLFDPTSGTLRLVTHQGFGDDFLHFFEFVDGNDESACGRALRRREQTVIRDVREDADYAPYGDIAADAGYRAVQSTPLLDPAGRVLGVVSTHHEDPWLPTSDDLMVARMYADLAGMAIARRLDDSTSHSDGVSELAAISVRELFDLELKLDSVRSAIGDRPGSERLAAASEQIDALIARIRRFVRERT